MGGFKHLGRRQGAVRRHKGTKTAALNTEGMRSDEAVNSRDCGVFSVIADARMALYCFELCRPKLSSALSAITLRAQPWRCQQRMALQTGGDATVDIQRVSVDKTRRCRAEENSRADQFFYLAPALLRGSVFQPG